jgi:hypothetical protein|tara:strand:- start:248 stop:658 length:411 start_codon:yes stop_codon:yes gene_type:complete
MKTPPSVVAKAVAYWAALYAVLIVPQFSKNYIVNLLWMTLIAPNAMRFAIGKIPQLAVDRGFFLVSTLVAFILTYLINRISPDTREAMKNSKASNSKKLKLFFLLLGTFAIGALVAYFGMDKSVYSNMGWESNSNF